MKKNNLILKETFELAVGSYQKKDFDTTIGIHPSAAEEFVTMRSPRN